MIRQFALVLVSLALLYSGALQAQPPASPARAFAFFDQNPVVQIYGLPRAHGYGVLNAGHQRWRFYLSQSSHFVQQHSGAESLLFDGATTRAAVVYARGLADGWQVRATLPLVRHSGGFADGLIIDFHRTFGFDARGRQHVPDGRQRYYYSRNGETRLLVEDSPSGVGDIRLALKKRLPIGHDWGMSVAAQLKLPTGQADRLTGSGGTDLALWVVVGNRSTSPSPWRFLTGLGVLATSDGDVLPNMRRNVAGFGWLVLGYELTPEFVVRGQFYLHTALYKNTAMEALNGLAVQGAFGFAWQLSRRSTLSFAFIEDFNAGVTPDVALNMGITYRY